MSKSKRIRRAEEKTCQSRKIIQKEIKKDKALKTIQILNILKDAPHFVDCLAEDEIASTKIQSFPSYFIVNIDSSDQSGSHWIAVGIYKDMIEIFDPLGFKIFKWSRIPCKLLQFLHRLVGTRTLKISKRIQSSNSNLCGFYCIFYVLMRPYFSWNMIERQFTVNLANNDLKLINLLK